PANDVRQARIRADRIRATNRTPSVSRIRPRITMPTGEVPGMIRGIANWDTNCTCAPFQSSVVPCTRIVRPPGVGSRMLGCTANAWVSPGATTNGPARTTSADSENRCSTVALSSRSESIAIAYGDCAYRTLRTTRLCVFAPPNGLSVVLKSAGGELIFHPSGIGAPCVPLTAFQRNTAFDRNTEAVAGSTWMRTPNQRVWPAATGAPPVHVTQRHSRAVVVVGAGQNVDENAG